MLTLDRFTPRTRDIVDLLRRLAEIESPTSDKAGVDRVGDLIAAELNRLGAHVTVDLQETAGNHVLGRWEHPQGAGDILVLCHMDTVHPVGTLGINPVVERDGLLFGPGVQDMKGGIAILLAVLTILQEVDAWPARSLTALFTSDEEGGSHTSRPLIERLARSADLVLCMEPSLEDGSLKTSRKGVGGFQVVARGRAAHAGANHAEGRNAIEELAHQILAIQAMTDYELGTTLNVGVVEGGTETNVVPAEARARVDLRVTSQAEAERVLNAVADLQPVLEGTSLDIQGNLNRPPMPRDGRMAAAFEKARRLGEKLGLSLTEGAAGGGSDANFVAPLGVTVLDGLGAVGQGMHTTGEYVQIDRLAERAALLAAILTEW